MDLKWALAFIEGEGSFCIVLTGGKRWRLYPSFAIALNIHDEPVLSAMRDLFHEFEIFPKFKTCPPNGNSRTPIAHLEVRGTIQCNKLAPLFTSLQWYSRKYRDFLIWEYALKLFEEIRLRPHPLCHKVWVNQVIYDFVYLRSSMNSGGSRSKENQSEILGWDLEPSDHILVFLEDLDGRLFAHERRLRAAHMLH